MSVFLAVVGVYSIGYAIAFRLMCDDDGPIAFLLAIAWPVIVAVTLWLKWCDWRANAHLRFPTSKLP